MKFLAEHIAYSETDSFSKLVTDYISGDSKLKPFYKHDCNLEGIKASIQSRIKYNTDRNLLVNVLKQQYAKTGLSDLQAKNIQQLLESNTFTITTAHQPNIFTGPLFFIYKILHAIKLADFLKKEIPENNFVPFYYMGSEDADLDELGHVFINGEKSEWKTNQTGAVGRMKVDDDLLKMIDLIEGQVNIYPFGKEISEMLKRNYSKGATIEQATFLFVHQLFTEYGLLILLPDNAVLKNAFAPVIEKELKEQFSHKSVLQTLEDFPKEYKSQASGRMLNLFYLKDNKRERIEIVNSIFVVQNTALKFDLPEIVEELKNFPERFSPNVILRPVFQELILPNIVFIGGGGELAYWLELKKVFVEVKVPFPVLILRNSFLIIQKDLETIVDKLELSNKDLFSGEAEILNQLVKKESLLQLTLEQEKIQLKEIYQKIQQISSNVDSSLQQHVAALQQTALKRIEKLERKLLNAEKKKFEITQRQLHKLKNNLFPNNNLQERIDNFIPYYAKFGNEFIQELYQNSLTLDSKFTILKS